MYLVAKNPRKNIADEVQKSVGIDGEKWVNYLEQYSLEVEQ